MTIRQAAASGALPGPRPGAGFQADQTPKILRTAWREFRRPGWHRGPAGAIHISHTRPRTPVSLRRLEPSWHSLTSELRRPCAQITVDEHHDSLVHHRPIPSPPTQSSRCCLSPLAHAQVGDHELFAVVNVVAVVKASASSRSSPSRQGVGVVKASASTQLLDSPSRTSFTPP